jgi:phosphoribosylformimino-5-aminoimidazole carboxamide ribotide isomerase
MKTFYIYPAIDIHQGRCVRLEKGDFSRKVVYSESPWEVAMRWEDAGARRLHVVDLDGAVSGRPENIAVVERIIASVNIPVQCGGGVRSEETLRAYFEAGAFWVVMGTRAVNDPDFLKWAISQYPGRVLASLDAWGDKAAVEGWRTESKIAIDDLLQLWERYGLERIVYTDISRDGTLQGFDVGGLREIAGKTSLSIIASGGISSIDDLVQIRSLREHGVEGAIIGKALYDGRIQLETALELEKD